MYKTAQNFCISQIFALCDPFLHFYRAKVFCSSTKIFIILCAQYDINSARNNRHFVGKVLLQVWHPFNPSPTKMDFAVNSHALCFTYLTSYFPGNNTKVSFTVKIFERARDNRAEECAHETISSNQPAALFLPFVFPLEHPRYRVRVNFHSRNRVC